MLVYFCTKFQSNMLQTSQILNRLTESATLKMAQLSRELKAQGKDIISLSLGEPDFNTPDHIRKAAKEAIDAGFDSYPPVPGYLDLRQAICAKLKRENGLDYTPEQIVVSTGAKHSLANIMVSYLDAGDEVIILGPYWVSYPEQVNMMGATPVTIYSSIETDFKVSAAQIEAAITPKTKFLIYSSPSNPAGAVYSKAELEAIARVIERHPHVYVISDEIYEHINYIGKHESIAQFDFIKDRVIVVNGMAKGFAMTGWRIGYIAAPLDIAKACTKLQGQFTSGASSIAQRATLAALTMDMQPTYEMRKAFQKRRDMVVAMLKDIPGVKSNLPDGAFYVFPDFSSYFGKSYKGEIIKDADDLCMYLLNEAFVAGVSGAPFGSPECIRWSYAASETDLKEAFSRIKVALEKLV
jgi:aspartate aminotransferase